MLKKQKNGKSMTLEYIKKLEETNKALEEENTKLVDNTKDMLDKIKKLENIRNADKRNISILIGQIKDLERKYGIERTENDIRWVDLNPKFSNILNPFKPLPENQ